MPSPPTPAEIELMFTIFNNKDGIWPFLKPEQPEEIKKPDLADLKNLTDQFDEEITRISQLSIDRNMDRATNLTPIRLQQIRSISQDTFTIQPVSIDSLQSFINSLDPSFSHLGIYYGFDLTIRKMVLVMQGIRLDGSDNGSRLANKLLENQVSSTQITTMDLTPRPRDFTLVRQFRELFGHIHGKGNFVWGAYMKRARLLEVLAEFEAEQCNKVKITFGFQKTLAVRISTLDRTCFHLIFKGEKRDGTASAKTFSTFDGEPGYVAPKPSCPPFGSFDE